MTEEKKTEILDREYERTKMNPYEALDRMPGFREYCEAHYPEFFYEDGDLHYGETWIVEEYNVSEKGERIKEVTRISKAYAGFLRQREDFEYSMEKTYSDDPDRLFEEMKNSIYQFPEDYIYAFMQEAGIELTPEMKAREIAERNNIPEIFGMALRSFIL